MIVISCGTNDTDTRSGIDVAHHIIRTVHQIRELHPESRIVVSETTPRKYERDDQIQVCNKLLHEGLRNLPNVAVAAQANLRDPTWSFHEDDKHIKQNKINMYAGNLKSAMRKLREWNGNQENTDHPPSTNSMDSHQTTSTHQQLPPTASKGQHQGTHPHQQFLPPLTTIAQHQAAATGTHQQASSTTSIVPPLMSVMGVAPSMQPANANFNNSGPPPPGKPPSPPHVADPQAPNKDNQPIGVRLRRISESTNNGSHDHDMRDTLIQKLGDVIQCLQVGKPIL
jgi:hypothetical protein